MKVTAFDVQRAGPVQHLVSGQLTLYNHQMIDAVFTEREAYSVTL